MKSYECRVQSKSVDGGRWIGETVRRRGGGTGLELAGGESCAAVVVFGCMVVGLLPGIAGFFGAGFRTNLVLGELFGSSFREVLTTNLH